MAFSISREVHAKHRYLLVEVGVQGLKDSKAFLQKEVKTSMKYFKIKRTWSVKAEDEAEAFRLVTANPTEHLESEEVTRTEYLKPKQETGWAAGFRNQLAGHSNSKR